MARAGAPPKKSFQNGGAPRLSATAARQHRASEAASAASAPERRRQQLVDLGAGSICASTGAAPSVPIATQSGARLTIAGVKKSQSSGRSTALTGMPSCARIVGDAAVERIVAARGENHHGAGKMAGRDSRLRHVSRRSRRSSRRGPAPGASATMLDRGARLAEQPRLGERLVAAADDDHARALDPHENGKGVELGGRLQSRVIRAIFWNVPVVLTLVRRTKKECTRVAFSDRQSLFPSIDDAQKKILRFAPTRWRVAIALS